MIESVGIETRNAIRKAEEADDVRLLLRPFAARQLTVRDHNLISKTLDRVKMPTDIKVAFLGSHTLEPLPTYVRVIGACHGLGVAVYVGGFGQYFQEILDEGSGLRSFSPEVIYLSLGIRELAPDVFHGFAALRADDLHAQRDAVLETIEDWCAAAKARTEAILLISDFVAPPYSTLGVADSKAEISETEFYARLNLDLRAIYRTDPRVYVVGSDRLAARYGKGRAFSTSMYCLAKIPWDDQFNGLLAEELTRFLKASRGLTKKCLVLDLDNTLWGGFLGEDGCHGVRVGSERADGMAFRDFQFAVKALQQQGVLLAIASKNNQADVEEMFSARRDMPLKWDDFSAIAINWKPKHENVIELAEKLNIGLDSIVFLDDSPAEIALIEEMLPDVTSVLLPRDPDEYADFIRRNTWFDRLAVTGEDRDKTLRYQENRQRRLSREATADLDAFYRSLGTRLCLRRATLEDVPRAHQLVTKTNQFNVAGRRYSVGEIQRLIKDRDHDVLIGTAGDRYGDLGAVSLVIAERCSEFVAIDTFVLSCRAIGRRLETAIMNSLKRLYLSGDQFATIYASYVPTSKNRPAEGFFAEQGFSLVERSTSGVSRYQLRRSEGVAIADVPLTVVNEI